MGKVTGVLADLKAAREGGNKRASTFEVKKEDAVFDQVSDEQYAQLVAKRRMEAGARESLGIRALACLSSKPPRKCFM